MTDSSVKVAVRIRHTDTKDSGSAKDSSHCLTIRATSRSIELTHPLQSLRRGFTYDHVYARDEGGSQADVYRDIGRPILRDLFDGINTMLFCYGASNTGKSYSLVGTVAQPGILPRFSGELFAMIGTAEDAFLQYRVSISFCELFNEKVFDLLAIDNSITIKSKKVSTSNLDSARNDLRIREHPIYGSYVENLSRRKVHSASELHELVWRAMALSGLDTANAARPSHTLLFLFLSQCFSDDASVTSNWGSPAMSPSEQVSTRSRKPPGFPQGKFTRQKSIGAAESLPVISTRMPPKSVTLPQIGSFSSVTSPIKKSSPLSESPSPRMETARQEAGSSAAVRECTVTFCDLSGTDKGFHNNQNVANKVTSSNLYRSLSCLSRVIAVLSSSSGKTGAAFAPFRESALTLLLKDKLSGNCKNVLIATLSPFARHYDQSLATLQFAERARRVTSTIVLPQMAAPSPTVLILKEITDTIAELQRQREAICLLLGIGKKDPENGEGAEQQKEKSVMAGPDGPAPFPARSEVKSLPRNSLATGLKSDLRTSTPAMLPSAPSWASPPEALSLADDVPKSSGRGLKTVKASANKRASVVRVTSENAVRGSKQIPVPDMKPVGLRSTSYLKDDLTSPAGSPCPETCLHSERQPSELALSSDSHSESVFDVLSEMDVEDVGDEPSAPEMNKETTQAPEASKHSSEVEKDPFARLQEIEVALSSLQERALDTLLSVNSSSSRQNSAVALRSRLSLPFITSSPTSATSTASALVITNEPKPFSPWSNVRSQNSVSFSNASLDELGNAAQVPSRNEVEPVRSSRASLAAVSKVPKPGPKYSNHHAITVTREELAQLGAFRLSVLQAVGISVSAAAPSEDPKPTLPASSMQDSAGIGSENDLTESIDEDETRPSSSEENNGPQPKNEETTIAPAHSNSHENGNEVQEPGQETSIEPSGSREKPKKTIHFVDARFDKYDLRDVGTKFDADGTLVLTCRHQTVNEAIVAAVNGDEVIVADGEYEESIIITQDIVLRGARSPIPQQQQQKGKPKNRQNRVTLISGKTKPALTVRSKAMITGIHFAQNGGNCCVWMRGGCTFRDCDITGSNIRSCMLVSDHAAGLITDCRIHDGTSRCIGLWLTDGVTTEVCNNKIWGNGDCGVVIEDMSSAPDVHHNEIVRGRGGGVGIIASTPVIRSNQITGNTCTGIVIADGANPTVEANEIANCYGGGLLVDGESTMGSIYGNHIHHNSDRDVCVKEHAQPHLLRNRIHEGSGYGIVLCRQAGGLYEENEVFGYEDHCIVVREASDGRFFRNTITFGLNYGVLASEHGKGLFEENRLVGAVSDHAFTTKTGGRPVVRLNHVVATSTSEGSTGPEADLK